MLAPSATANLVDPAVMSLAQNGSCTAANIFTITGKVEHPDNFNLRDGMRVSDAIVAAGGFVDFANTKKITIFRGENGTTLITEPSFAEQPKKSSTRKCR